MKQKKKIILFTIAFVALIFIIGINSKVYAAPGQIPIPRVNISVDNSTTPQNYVDNIKLLILLTVLSLLPSFIVMMTSFVRTILVLGFLRNAMGTQQSPPNQVIIGLALFLTFFIMSPVYNEINTKALKPFLDNKITQEVAFQEGAKPLREFMLRQTRQKDLKLFLEVGDRKSVV